MEFCCTHAKIGFALEVKILCQHFEKGYILLLAFRATSFSIVFKVSCLNIFSFNGNEIFNDTAILFKGLTIIIRHDVYMYIHIITFMYEMLL